MDDHAKPVTAWSFSRYECYMQCPRRFKLKFIDKLPEPGSDAMERGSRIHKGAEKFLRGEVKRLPDDLILFDEQMHELRDLNPLVEQQWGFTDAWKPTGWFAQDTWFRQVVDAGAVYDDGTADIIDHKTGKRYKDNEEQIELFSISAMLRYRDVHHVTARLWYIDSGEEVIREYERKDVKPILADWEDRVEPMLTAEKYPPRPNNRCKWCAFSRANGGSCEY